MENDLDAAQLLVAKDIVELVFVNEDAGSLRLEIVASFRCSSAAKIDPAPDRRKARNKANRRTMPPQ
jgi:hypothetical protein